MLTDRRSFLQTSVMLGCAAVADRVTLAQTTGAAIQEGSALIERMTWMNEPASWKKNSDQLLVHSRPKTDFWRKTTTGTLADNGHFFYLPVSGDFVFQVRVSGEYAAAFDQAGLMVRLNAENWMKCGTELFQGHRCASVVFTRGFSDWSTMPDLSETQPVWWRAVRKNNSIQTQCSLDGKNFVFVRDGYFEPSVPVQVGIMSASPTGSGFEAVFEHLKLET